MGRLIDADAVNAKLRNIYEHEKDVINSAWLLNTLIDKVDEIPTAYAPDKVAEQMEKMSYERLENNGMGGELVINLDDAIEIVKGGGVDDKNI